MEWELKDQANSKARHVSFKVLGMYLTNLTIPALVKIKSNLTWTHP